MKYRLLGRTGVRVSELSFGCMTFGSGGMFGIACVSPELATEMVSLCIDYGVNLFDTADIYDQGRSEELLGKSLVGRRDRVLIATKFGARMSNAPNDLGGTRSHIIASVEQSLRRLETDYIDLYQMHIWDDITPVEETLSALDDLIRAGKVRYIGCSNFAAWQVMKSLWASEHGRWHRFESLQMHYNLLMRDIEREHVPLCVDQGLSVVAWSPLMGGFLSGKFRRGQPRDHSWRRGDPDNFINQVDFLRVDEERGLDVVEVAHTVAEKLGAKVAQVAIAWLLSKPAVASVIVGAKTLEQLRDDLAAASLEIGSQELKTLDAVTGVPKGYPYAMAAYMRAGR